MKVATTKTFDEDIKEGTVLVDFWAPWCSQCKTLIRNLEEIDTIIDNKIVKINVDENMELAERFSIRNLPVLLMFKDGELVKDQRGNISKTKLMEWIEE